MTTEPKVDVVKARDAEARKRSGWVAACLTFGAAYAIFVISCGYWGLALGLLPSTMIAAAIGWMTYCFPWWIEAVGLVLELLMALG
jgi:hypothetical protein